MIGCNINIPFFGKGIFLNETLASILRQTASKRALEISIFDNCSPEPATQAISPTMKQRCQLFRNSSNVGLAENWRRCLEYGDRECVHVLHADDTLDPTFYVKVLDLFARHENLGLVHTGYRPFLTRKSSLAYWRSLLSSKPIQNEGVQLYAAGDDAVRHVINGVLTPSVVLRRKAVVDVGLFRSDLYSPDEEYWARVAARWNVAFLTEPLVKYRYHDQNNQVQAWMYPDFWLNFQATRQARLAHLACPNDEEIKKEAASLGRLAVSIALKLLATGEAKSARNYLEHALAVYPDISSDLRFRRVSRWISEGFFGRCKAVLCCSH
jgi:glycosyltransferase involved in cell wall biosynthesis